MIPDYKIDGPSKDKPSAYKQKVLERFYQRKFNRRELLLTRKECNEQFQGPSEFVHLNCHTMFSVMSAVDEPEALFKYAKENEFKSIAITETGYMSSIPDCWQAAKSSGVKFIPGISAYFNDFEVKRREIIESDPKLIKDHPFLINYCAKFRTPNVTLIAKNPQGYKDLLNLNAESWVNGFYYTPRINRQMLQKYVGNIIVLSGTLIDDFIKFGFIKSISNPEYNALSAYDYLKWFTKTFERDFYVELTMRCIDSHFGSDLDRVGTLMPLLKNVESEIGMKPQLVMTNDVRHTEREDFNLLRSLQAISRNTTLNRVREYSTELYMKTRSELRATFHTCLYDRMYDIKQFEEACDNTIAINDRCDPFKADTSPKLPEIEDSDMKLKRKVAEALVKKGFIKDKTKYEVDGKMVTYVEQASIELNRFIEKGFSSYFLIMQDLIQHSYDLGYEIGPARGSAGGSLVCYLLGITNLNPFLFGLSFDRFLSASRGGYMLKLTME